MNASGEAVRAFAPAGVGNIGVGFDLLGHSIDGPRDVARVRRIEAPTVRIRSISGDVAGIETLPLDPSRVHPMPPADVPEMMSTTISELRRHLRSP